MPTTARRRPGRLLPKVLLALVAVAALLEGTVRFLLLSETAATWPTAALRVPARLADPYNDELFWQIQNVWNVELAVRRAGGDREKFRAMFEPARYDPIVGWIGSEVSPGDYAHAEAAGLAGRRAVLLYGDSFAACTTPPGDCFQGWLARSPLGREYALLNYGVGGYGFDQAYLLMRHSLDALAAQRPVVVMSLLVDEDMDRSILSFRGWPKPRLVARGDALELEESPIPSRDAYFERHGLTAGSYAWRLLVHGTRILPEGARRALSGEPDRIERIRALNRAIFAAVVRELEARRLDYFFLLFYSEAAFVAADFPTWRDAIACDALRELGAPVVSARRAILEHAEATGHAIGDYFERAEPGSGHYNALGNEAAFRAIEDGLSGRFDLAEAGRSELPLATAGVLPAEIPARKVLRGVGAAARVTTRPGADGALRPCLVLRPGHIGPTEARFALAGRFGALRARPALAGETAAGARVGLTVLADGAELLRLRLGPGDAPGPIQLDLGGRAELVIRLDDGGDGARGDALVLDELELVPAGG